MSERAPSSRRQAPALAALLALAAVAVVVGLAGAVAGPTTVFAGDGPGLRTTPPSSALPSDTEAATPPPVEVPSSLRPDGTRRGHLVGVLLRWLLLLAVLLVLARWIRSRWRNREPLGRLRRVAEEDLGAVDPVATTVAAMLRDAAEQERRLRTGTPRNAVVECWHRFELQARDAGVPRHPWETTTEFGLRLLGLVSADFTAVATLARLFRAARYSDHELTEDDRAAALDALARIHAGLVVTKGPVSR